MVEFEYKGFWIESTPFNQAENGHQKKVLPTQAMFIGLRKTVML